MEISPRKLSNQATEPADEWLKNEGYYRKVFPKDSTCLFRAVSEQIYMTQYYHIKVRDECVEFMRNNKDLFQENIAVPMEDYLKQLSCVTEWGGMNEIEAMSRLYKCDFIIFYCQQMKKKNVTNNGFDKTIKLCHTSPRQYETMYEQNYIKTAAYCQSIVYQTLYKDVFKMSDIGDTIQNMLHYRSGNNRHDKVYVKSNISTTESLTTNVLNKIDIAIDDNDEPPKNNSYVGLPFSYRVAKALDPNIFRNTDFDIWHELKREVRNGGWIRWNNAELQVGGKCLVQMDYIQINKLDESNNNLQKILSEQNNDKNENITTDNNNKTVKKESTLLVGHIQEMSKDEGPVLVFIEELGEKKIVPYASLKPLYEHRKPRSPSVHSPIYRKNSSYDHGVVRWKKQWNSNTRKTKDSMSNGAFMTLDRINNNRSSNDSPRDNKKNISNKNINWSGNSSLKTNSALLKNYTSIENYSINQQYSMDNTVEVRPLSIVLDNPQPLTNPTADSKEDFRKKSSTLVNNKNSTESYDKSLNNNNNSTTENANIVQLPQQSPVSTSNETFFPPHSTGPPPSMYSGNLNVVCVSPDGNVYAPLSFFGGNIGGPSPPPPLPSTQPPTNVVDRANQIVNLGIQSSVDVSGNDLPYTDIPTLRFFFNLGVDYFRNNHIWAQNNPPSMAFTPTFVPQSNTVLTLPASEVTPSNETAQQPSNNPPNNSRPHQPLNRRKNEQTFNSNRSNTHSYVNPKSTYSRTDTHQDSAKNKNESSHHSSYDFQKSKPSYSNHENQREYNNSNWEPRKNNVQGRFKKNNEGRNRNDRSTQQHHEYHQRSYNNQLNNSNTTTTNNNKNNFGKSESQHIQKAQPEVAPHQMQPMNPPPIQTPIPASSPPYHQHMSQPSAAIYTNVPYYANEADNFFPPNTNMYPIPYIAQAETVDGGSNPNHYICAGPENYPQSISPIYAPIPYPPPPLYSAVSGPNPQENWYTIHGPPPHFIQYPQLVASQQQQQQQQQQLPQTINTGTQSSNN